MVLLYSMRRYHEAYNRRACAGDATPKLPGDVAFASFFDKAGLSSDTYEVILWWLTMGKRVFKPSLKEHGPVSLDFTFELSGSDTDL